MEKSGGLECRMGKLFRWRGRRIRRTQRNILVDPCGSVCTVHNEIGRELVSAGKVFRDTRVRSSMGRLDGSYAQYGAASAQIHDRDSGVRRDRMTV